MGKQLGIWLTILILVVILLACQEGATARTETMSLPTVSPTFAKAVYLDMFEAVWETINVRYVDPTFGGVDCPAAYDRYRPFAAAQNDGKCCQVINQAVTGAILGTAKSADGFITVVGSAATGTVYMDQVQVSVGIPDIGP